MTIWCCGRTSKKHKYQATNKKLQAKKGAIDLPLELGSKQYNQSSTDDLFLDEPYKTKSKTNNKLISSENKKHPLHRENVGQQKPAATKILRSVEAKRVESGPSVSVDKGQIPPSKPIMSENLLSERWREGRTSSRICSSVPARKTAASDRREQKEAIPISAFGELSSKKPLKLLSVNQPCSLRVTDQYFDLFWSSASPQTFLFNKTKRSIQCSSDMVWISGSVTRDAKGKAWILNPFELTVSMCGVEQGLSKALGGLPRSSDFLGIASTKSIVSMLSYETLTPPWFACEGFFLKSTRKGAKKILEYILKEFLLDPVATIIWEFLPWFRFKDRDYLNAHAKNHVSYKVEDDENLMRPFCLVPWSKTELTLSKIELGTYVQSNIDARFSSIWLSHFNGSFICPDQSPARLRMKMVSRFLQQKYERYKQRPWISSESTSRRTLRGDKYNEQNGVKGITSKNHQPEGQNRQHFESIEVLPEVLPSHSKSTDIESKQPHVGDTGKLLSRTPIELTSYTNFTLEEIPTSSLETARLSKFTPSFVSSLAKSKEGLQPKVVREEYLAMCIDDFWEQFMEAVITALSSEENECNKIIKRERVDESKTESIRSFKIERFESQPKSINRAEVKTYEVSKQMVLLLCSENSNIDFYTGLTSGYPTEDIEYNVNQKSGDRSLVHPDLESSVTPSNKPPATRADLNSYPGNFI
jgi:hypothetical protein